LSYSDGTFIFDTDFDKIIRAFQRNGVFSGWNVTPNDDIRGITVSAGSGKVNGIRRQTTSPTSFTLDENTSGNPRRDLIIIDSTGTPSFVTGLPSPEDPANCGSSAPYGSRCKTPKMPDLPDGAIALAEVWVPAGYDQPFTSNHIRDLRVFTLPSYGYIYDPSEYGGNTLFDQLQNAIDDVPVNGGTVIVPNETIEGEGLTLKNNLTLFGVGAGSTIKFISGATNHLIHIDGLSDVTISNIRFDGNSIEKNLIFIEGNSKRINICRNKFTANSEPCVYVCSTLPDITMMLSVSFNEFYDGANASLICFGEHSDGTYSIKDCEVCHNKLYNLTVNGKIGLANVENGIVADNTLLSCQTTEDTASLVLRGGKNVRVSRNKVINCTSNQAMALGDSQFYPARGFIIFENNLVFGHTGKGFGQYFGTGADVESLIIRNNVFKDVSDTNIDTSGKSYATVEIYGNTVESLDDLVTAVNHIVYGNKIWQGERVCKGEMFPFDGAIETVAASSTTTIKKLLLPANRKLRIHAKWGHTNATESAKCYIKMRNETDATDIDETDVYNLSYTIGSPLASVSYDTEKLISLQYRNADTSNHSISGGYLISIG